MNIHCRVHWNVALFFFTFHSPLLSFTVYSLCAAILNDCHSFSYAFSALWKHVVPLFAWMIPTYSHCHFIWDTLLFYIRSNVEAMYPTALSISHQEACEIVIILPSSPLVPPVGAWFIGAKTTSNFIWRALISRPGIQPITNVSEIPVKHILVE